MAVIKVRGLSNQQLADEINAFWRARGREARARVEPRTYTFGGHVIIHQEVVTDSVNGQPPKRAQRWEAFDAD